MTYGLSFISDDDLFNHVADTVKKYRFKIDLKGLNKNLLDPVKLTFDSLVYHGAADNAALEKVLQNEVLHQMDKSNTNHIGYFHQNIFHYIGKEQGWIVPEQGFDIENHRLNVFVEMKNKHNTMNSSSSAKTYMRMQNKLLQNPQARCYLVEIIAKRSQNIQWSPTVDDEKMSDERIRRMSIDKFYELVTGEQTAFADLCRILPTVIADVIKQNKKQLIENTVLQDLKNSETDHILQSLYLLAFKTYQGFENFQFND